MDLGTILNVDDNEVNRYIRTQILQEAGFRVTEAATGQDAIARFLADKPLLVLLDMNLPDMNGDDVCRRIKAYTSNRALVVHISATYVNSSDQARGLESGADGYLCEPVEPELLLATVRSFLRLRSAEAMLQDSEERLKLAQTIAGLGFWEWDVRENTVVQSGGNFGDSGVKSLDAWLSAVHGEDRGAVEELLERAREDGGSFQCEFRVIWPDSSVHWLSTKGRVFFDNQHKTVRVMGTDMEVTERKKTELALQRSNEDLSQFAHMVSHDLQEPLRTITSFTQLLSAKYGPELGEEAGSFMSYIIEGSRRMHTMIRDLLAFCQIQDLQLEQFQLVPMTDLVCTVLSNISAAVNEAGAIITYDSLPTVWGDGAQLSEVVQNLMTNALKYRKPGEGPRIHIASEQRNGEWLISVTDNGIGFDQRQAERIFGIFKRLHGRDIPGTGIGLSIAKKIIERHRGRIWAESHPGEGARFSFALPIPS
jgi:signal transduction histidine kinase